MPGSARPASRSCHGSGCCPISDHRGAQHVWPHRPLARASQEPCPFGGHPSKADVTSLVQPVPVGATSRLELVCGAATVSMRMVMWSPVVEVPKEYQKTGVDFRRSLETKARSFTYERVIPGTFQKVPASHLDMVGGRWFRVQSRLPNSVARPSTRWATPGAFLLVPTPHHDGFASRVRYCTAFADGCASGRVPVVFRQGRARGCASSAPASRPCR
jgi:hypothetical protein